MRFILTLLLTLVAVGNVAASGSFETYEGVYRVFFEVSSFVPKSKAGNWWLEGKIPCLEKYEKADPDLANIPALYLKVEGTLSPEGHYGHLNTYSRKLEVHKVLECRIASPNEGK